MKTIRFLVASLFLGILPLASAKTSPPQSQFVVGMSADITTFYPPASGGVIDRDFYMQIFDALLHRTPNGDIVGRLATSWKAINPTTWRFTLRKGVKFTDGEPMDANAVKYSLDLYRAPSSVIASMFRSIASVQVVDAYTVDVQTVEPDPLLPNAVTDNGFILPPTYLKKVGASGFASSPVGTGPYIVKNRVRGDRITLVANQNYWGGTVPIAKVIWRAIPEPGARVAALQSGEADLIIEVPPAQVSILKRMPSVRVETVPTPRAVYIGLWPDSPLGGGKPLSDVRVRQALNYAVNKKAIIKALLQGYATPLGQPIPNASYRGYNDAIKPYPYDPAKARELLAAAGYANGFSMEMLSTERFLTPEQAAAIASDLAAVGVKLKINQVDYGRYTTLLVDQHSYPPMYALSIQGRQDIEAYEIYSVAIASSGSFNWNHYSNPKVDALIAKMGSEFDADERAALGRQVAQLTHDDAPWIYLWNNSAIWALKSIWKWQPRSDDLLSIFDDVSW